MILRDVKILLGIKLDDTSQDDKLSIYIRRAVHTIQNYLNIDKFTDEDIENLYSEAIISLVSNAHKIESEGIKNIKSKSQGARSVTYSDDTSFTITDDVKSILPVPFIRMR